jgi:hypothetical protein
MRELFALLGRLDQMLEQFQFDQYAELKSAVVTPILLIMPAN